MSGPIHYLTVVSPAEPDGVELSLEPGGLKPEVAAHQAWLRDQGIPATAFAVDDIDAEHARLTELGVSFRAPPADFGEVRGAVLDDTCGNLLMLYAPIASQTASA